MIGLKTNNLRIFHGAQVQGFEVEEETSCDSTGLEKSEEGHAGHLEHG